MFGAARQRRYERSVGSPRVVARAAVPKGRMSAGEAPNGPPSAIHVLQFRSDEGLRSVNYQESPMSRNVCTAENNLGPTVT
jgi:hypothetical protein